MDTNHIKAGWIQINNAACPFLIRQSSRGTCVRLAPVKVLHESAKINFCRQPITFQATDKELVVLNWLCSKENVPMTFTKGTELTSLSIMQMFTKDRVHVHQLPFSDPLRSMRAFPELRPKNDGPVPTVVSDFNEIQQPKSTQQSRVQNLNTDNIHIKQMRRDVAADEASSKLFAEQKVAGLQFLTVYKAKMLCVVKPMGKFVFLEDIQREFFSKWPSQTFHLVAFDLLKIRVYALSKSDISIVRKLSGDSKSRMEVISVLDLQRLLPKVKALMKRVVSTRKSQIGRGTLSECKKENIVHANQVIPKLSDLMPTHDRSESTVCNTRLACGIGAKFNAQPLRKIGIATPHPATPIPTPGTLRKNPSLMKIPKWNPARVVKKHQKPRSLQAILDKLVQKQTIVL